MARHFSAQHTAAGYAAMGNHRRRPNISIKTRTVAESIAHGRRVQANQAKSKKKA